MNKTETLAYDWLVNTKGYSKHNITFQQNECPDFIVWGLPGGYEVKKLYGNRIYFQVHQLERITNMCDCSILIYGDNPEPLYVVPSHEIHEHCRKENLLIRLSNNGENHFTKEEWHKLRPYFPFRDVTFGDIKNCLEKLHIDTSQVLTISEAAARLKVTRKTLYNWEKAGKITFIYFGKFRGVAVVEIERVEADRRAEDKDTRAK